jgi:hypothetical protein
MHDAYQLGFNAENFVRDLGERGFETLTVRVDTDAQFEPAVRRHARGGLFVSRHHRDAPAGIDRRAMRGLFAIDREANADQPPIRLFRALARAHRRDIDRRKCAVHGFRIIAAVEMFLGDVVERHLVRLDQIAQPDFAGLNPGRDGDRIQHDLQCKADAGAGNAAIRQDRAFIGCGRERPATIGRHHVRTGQNARHLRGLETGGERIGRVSAGIDGRFAIDAAQAAVAIGIHRDLVVMLAAIGARDQMFAPVLDPAHDIAFAHRQPGKTDFFRQQNALMAEPAADIGRYDTDLALIHAHAIRQAVAHDVRHLRAGVERELIEAVIEGRDHAASLEW